MCFRLCSAACLSMCLRGDGFLCVCLSVYFCFFVCRSGRPSACLYICPSASSVSVSLPVCLAVCMSLALSVRLSVYLCVCLSLSLPLYVSASVCRSVSASDCLAVCTSPSNKSFDRINLFIMHTYGLWV